MSTPVNSSEHGPVFIRMASRLHNINTGNPNKMKLTYSAMDFDGYLDLGEDSGFNDSNSTSVASADTILSNTTVQCDGLEQQWLEHPSHTENFSQTLQNFNFNTTNMMNYRFRKMQQQQHLIPQYRQWYMMSNQTSHAIPRDTVINYSACSYHNQCSENMHFPLTLHACSPSEAYRTQAPAPMFTSSYTLDPSHTFIVPSDTIAPTMQYTNSSDTINTEKRKRRIKYTNEQKKSLERSFEINQYPSRETRNLLSVELGITPQQVIIWYQNRRMKYKDYRKPNNAQTKMANAQFWDQKKNYTNTNIL